MKIFTNEDGKEKVYVQMKDLRFIGSNKFTPEDILKYVPIESYSISNQYEYICFEDEAIINYLKSLNYILDYNKFSNMTKEEIDFEYRENQKQMHLLESKIMKLPKKERTVQNPKYYALMNFQYYKESIEEFLNSNELKMPRM